MESAENRRLISVLVLVLVFGSFGEVFEASFGEALQAFGLGEECCTKTAFNAAFAAAASEAGNRGSAAGDANVGVLPVREDAVGDDAPGVRLGQFYDFGLVRGFFVEDRAKLGICDDLSKNGVFGAVKILPALALRYRGDVEWPNANFGNLKGVEDVHCNGVGALVGEMASDSAPQAFVCLAYVNWFAVVVEECVDAPPMAADSLPIIGEGFEEGVDLLAYSGYVRGWA